MCRFNEGDVTDASASYLLSIKESVSNILQLNIYWVCKKGCEKMPYSNILIPEKL